MTSRARKLAAERRVVRAAMRWNSVIGVLNRPYAETTALRRACKQLFLTARNPGRRK